MPLLKGYENDVFISYAHHDNPPDALGGAGPVTRLVSFLEGQLPQRVGERGDYKIFFDHRDLKANHEIEHALAEVAASAIFVSITSPAYVADKSWALREMEAFLALPDSKDRFFSLEVLPIDNVLNFPQVFHERKRYKFWDDGGAENRVAMSLHPSIHPAAYVQQLTAFADQVAQKMLSMYRVQQEGGTSISVGGSAPPPEPIGTVLLTQTNDDVEFERVQMASFLEQANVRVLPEFDYPQGGDEFKAAFAEDLAQADLVVQLLGRAGGKMPRDLPEGYQHAQHEAAIAAGKPLIAWRHPELDMERVTSPVQRTLLDSSVTMVEGLESFKDEVLHKLREILKPAPPPRNDKLIYLGAEKTDRELAQMLHQALREREHDVVLPIFEGTAEEIQQDIDENLTDSDKIIVVQGKVPANWVRRYLLRARKIMAMRKAPPDLATLFKGPPPDKDDPGVALNQFKEFDSSDELDLDKFCAFVESAK